MTQVRHKLHQINKLIKLSFLTGYSSNKFVLRNLWKYRHKLYIAKY